MALNAVGALTMALALTGGMIDGAQVPAKAVAPSTHVTINIHNGAVSPSLISVPVDKAVTLTLVIRTSIRTYLATTISTSM
jgi:hypothetical protein